jgi:hypothetical protein
MTKSARGRPLLFPLLCLVLIVPAAGCATSTIAEDRAQPPRQARVLVVGRVESAKPEWERLVRRYRRSLAAHLRQTGAADEITWRPPVTVPADALVIAGRFEEIDDGSEAGRFLIGMGVGSPTLIARIRVVDGAGRTLLVIDQENDFSTEGGFSAHWQPLVMDEIADAFAEETAATIAAWLAGEDG